MATFTFDGPNKRIVVDAEAGDSAFTAAEVYSAWKDWVLLGNAQFEPAFAESVGGNPLGGGSSLDTYVFLRNDSGWRIRPDARDHTLSVDGQLFGASDVLPIFAAPLSAAIVTIERAFSARAVGVATSGSSPSDVAAAVWAALRASNVDAGSLGEALVRLYQIMGLDPTKPLVVTATTRKVPSDGSEIDQTIVEAPSGTVSVTTV